MDYDAEELDGFDHLRLRYKQLNCPYICIESKERLLFVADPVDLPRSYLRRCIAESIGEPHLADWMAFPSYAVVEQGAVRLKSSLKEQWRDRGAAFKPSGAA